MRIVMIMILAGCAAGWFSAGQAAETSTGAAAPSREETVLSLGLDRKAQQRLNLIADQAMEHAGPDTAKPAMDRKKRMQLDLSRSAASAQAVEQPRMDRKTRQMLDLAAADDAPDQDAALTPSDPGLFFDSDDDLIMPGRFDTTEEIRTMP